MKDFAEVPPKPQLQAKTPELLAKPSGRTLLKDLTHFRKSNKQALLYLQQRNETNDLSSAFHDEQFDPLPCLYYPVLLHTTRTRHKVCNLDWSTTSAWLSSPRLSPLVN